MGVLKIFYFISLSVFVQFLDCSKNDGMQKKTGNKESPISTWRIFLTHTTFYII